MTKPSLVDLHVYGGAVFVSVGVACIYPSGGLVALGLILLGLGLAPPRGRPGA